MKNRISCLKDSELVLIAMRVHPFPSRTRKLSSSAPKILVWRRTGKIGNANTRRSRAGSTPPLYASLAQSVEHAAVNRGVVGSSPTGGAREAIISLMLKPKRKTKNWVIPQLKMRRVRFPRWRKALVLELREEVILIGEIYYLPIVF